ncbi:MAG: hypothetical protein U1D70_09865 [Methylobacter sp.]|nr:hypothetical protein [Methylobacter sp.]MDP2428499.1 hypothetical protein [Methylobacter sp.]MDP3056243.1 hypothetical protein [Methylobacter sp.]MDP3363774.1 hypothetical protein [Methylobacter sp.]MDZ4219310.1 hypothetical protein [Methylobacter sp.]
MKLRFTFAPLCMQAQPRMLALLLFCPLSVSAADTWNYYQEKDRLSNRTYSLARSPLPPRGLYDNIRLEIVCKDSALQVVVDAHSLIASQGSGFDFEYQVDKNPPVTMPMNTFKDSRRRGYNDDDAKRIIDEIVTGQSIFIRVTTMIRKVLSAKISLDGAAESVKRVVSDCGLSLVDRVADGSAYSLAEFEQEFNKLSPENQQQVLDKIKQIMYIQKAP